MQINEIFFIGSNKYGQSGAGEKNNVKVIEQPKSYDFGIFIKQVSCGYHHSALLTISGLVYTMGSNIHGTLGTRHQGINYSFSPILVEGLDNVSKIESGAFHLCALTDQGHVYSWGRGMDGQLGVGSNKNSCLAQQVELQEDVQELSCGTNHTILVTTKGEVYAFGNGIYGQLGTGNNKNQLLPTKIKMQARISMVAAGQNHSLYLTTDGFVYGTGDNTSGQVGIGNSKKYVLDPQRLSQLSDVSIIQAAKFSACICNGQLYVWGGSTKQFTPFQVNSDCCFTELKTGNDSLMALSSKGDLFSWQAIPIEINVQLKKTILKSKTILDFSIGESHVIILGDIVRTVQEKQVVSPMLKCYEGQVMLKDITKQQNSTPALRSRPPTERDRSINKSAAQTTIADADKENKKSASSFAKQKNRHVTDKLVKTFENVQLSRVSESKDMTKEDQIGHHKSRENINSRLDGLTEEARLCKVEFQSVKSLLISVKRVQVNPSKNLAFFSRQHNKQNIVHNTSQNEKSNAILLREKDLKISRLQEQLSKKQALVSAYENTLETLNKVVQTQREQLDIMEPYFKGQSHLNNRPIDKSH